MWHENEYAWFKIEKGNLSKYTGQKWKTLHLTDIDQIQEEQVGIINRLDITLNHCFM